ncbi:hypothetical protein evm_012908 [Chilo suppressalis]|nr:hypothetical protein evm_012908 [Chilo suppressalis]
MLQSQHVECRTSGSLYFALQLSRLLGLAPVRFDALQGERRVQLAPALRFYGYALVAVLSQYTKPPQNWHEQHKFSIHQSLFSYFTDADGLYNIWNNMMIIKSSINNELKTRYMINTVLLIFTILATSIDVYGAPAKLKQIIWCLDCLQKARGAVNKNYKNPSLEKKKSWIVALITIHSVVVLNNGMIYAFLTTHNVVTGIKCICNVFQMMMMYCMALLFAFTAMEVYSTLESMNDVLQRLVCPSILANNHAKGSFKGRHMVRGFSWFKDHFPLEWKDTSDKYAIKQIHIVGIPEDVHVQVSHVERRVRGACAAYGRACEAAARLYATQELPIVMVLAICFYYLIAMSFCTVMEMTKLFVVTPAVANLVAWCVMKVLWLMIITEPCHLIQLEMIDDEVLQNSLNGCDGGLQLCIFALVTSSSMKVERARLYVSRLLSRHGAGAGAGAGGGAGAGAEAGAGAGAGTAGHAAAAIDLFSRRLMHNRLQFKPMGIFTLSRAFITSVVGTSLTYLVIIVQFQPSS